MFEAPSSSASKKKKYEHPSLINSMNFIDNHGNINIRLNLKNQFINNNTSNFNNITEVNYRLDMTEKLKEKDLKIIQLQNELLKSQEIINNFQIKNNLEINKYNKLNNSVNEKNICLTSVDKILKTAFNGYSSNNLIKEKTSNRKSYKNCFLKRSGNKNIIDYISKSKTKEKFEKKNFTKENNKTNKNIDTGNNKKKQSDYLRLFLPLSYSNNEKPRFNSYSNNRKNTKNSMKSNTENMSKREKNKNNFIINIEKKENSEEFLKFCKKCQELKTKTKNLLDKYINLSDMCKVKKK